MDCVSMREEKRERERERGERVPAALALVFFCLLAWALNAQFTGRALYLDAAKDVADSSFFPVQFIWPEKHPPPPNRGMTARWRAGEY